MKVYQIIETYYDYENEYEYNHSIYLDLNKAEKKVEELQFKNSDPLTSYLIREEEVIE